MSHSKKKKQGGEGEDVATKYPTLPGSSPMANPMNYPVVDFAKPDSSNLLGISAKDIFVIPPELNIPTFDFQLGDARPTYEEIISRVNWQQQLKTSLEVNKKTKTQDFGTLQNFLKTPFSSKFRNAKAALNLTMEGLETEIKNLTVEIAELEKQREKAILARNQHNEEEFKKILSFRERVANDVLTLEQKFGEEGKKKTSLQQTIQNTKNRIQMIEQNIANTTDPTKKQQLEQTKASAITSLTLLERELATLEKSQSGGKRHRSRTHKRVYGGSTEAEKQQYELLQKQREALMSFIPQLRSALDELTAQGRGAYKIPKKIEVKMPSPDVKKKLSSLLQTAVQENAPKKTIEEKKLGEQNIRTATLGYLQEAAAKKEAASLGTLATNMANKAVESITGKTEPSSITPTTVTPSPLMDTTMMGMVTPGTVTSQVAFLEAKNKLTALLDAKSLPIIQLLPLMFSIICLLLGVIISIYYLVLLIIMVVQQGANENPLNIESIDFTTIQSLSFSGGQFNYLYFMILPIGALAGVIVFAVLNALLGKGVPPSRQIKGLLFVIGLSALIMIVLQLFAYMKLGKSIKLVAKRLDFFNRYVCSKIYKNLRFLSLIQDPQVSIVGTMSSVQKSLATLSTGDTVENYAKAFFTVTLFYHYQKISLRNPIIFDAFDIFKPSSLLGGGCNPGNYLARYGTYIEDISETVIRPVLPKELQGNQVVEQAIILNNEWITNANGYANTIYPEDAFNSFAILAIVTILIQMVPVSLIVAFYSPPEKSLTSKVLRILMEQLGLSLSKEEQQLVTPNM